MTKYFQRKTCDNYRPEKYATVCLPKQNADVNINEYINKYLCSEIPMIFIEQFSFVKFRKSNYFY